MSIGRPKSSSRETLAEAACELFLEQGYAATSVADIALRAGVSRSSFFNYFSSKSDILWAGLDERISVLMARLSSDAAADPGLAARAALTALGEGFAPDSLALAVVHVDAMGLGTELEREAAVRSARIGALVAERLRRGGVPSIRADVAGAAHGGAVLAAITAWAEEGASRTALSPSLRVALEVAGRTLR